MHLQVTLTVASSPAVVARMLADPVYVRAKIRASGAVEQHVDIVPGADGTFTVTSRRSLPTDLIPSNIRPFVGASLDVRQVEAWEAARPDGSRNGTVVLEITGAPVRLTGTMTLRGVDGADGAHSAGSPDRTESADGPRGTEGDDGSPGAPAVSTVTYDGELKAGVPLFGGAVEQAAAGAVRAALEAEEKVAAEWVAGASDA